MCGISIVVNGSQADVLKMFGTTQHRGNEFSFKNVGNIRSAFTQLSITDQKAPLQPYQIGKYTIWFNGFISNYKELAEKYAIELKTNCDTELLAFLISKGGLNKNLIQQLNGFFAIVVYDGEKLDMVTDRYGIKQLYTYQKGEKTYICSEVKGILSACPEIKINISAVRDWKHSLGVMTWDTIYHGVKRVATLCPPPVEKIDISYEEAKIELRNRLNASFDRNRTELKSGVFLSGGVDSGVLAKEMDADYCFSMDFQDEKFSEIANIKINSKAIHYTMIHNSDLVEKYLPETMRALDDLKVGSCYTNFALTELASKFCTVLYSGAGADELFKGYTHRYSRPVSDVVKRTKFYSRNYSSLTHFQYDWLYLRGILVVEDRMAGWHTMETRYPFLDNDLVNFVLSLPDEHLINKRILKDVSGLDDRIINGKKRGFSNPISNEYWVTEVLKYKENEQSIRQQQPVSPIQ